MRRLLRNLVLGGGGVSLLPLNSIVAFDGDSHAIASLGSIGGGGTGDMEGRIAPGSFALDVAKSPGYKPPGYNFGVSGQRMITQILPRRATTFAFAPKLIYLSSGSNDLSSSETAANILAAFSTYCADAIAAGVEYVLISTVWARTGASVFTAPQEAQRVLLNAGLLAMASSRVKLIDCAVAIADSTFLTDGVHLNRKGDVAEGIIAGPVWASCFAAGADAASLLSITNGRAKPQTGTTGTLTGTVGVDVDGVAPTGWTLRGNTGGGAKVVGSKDTDGKMLLTISGAKTSTSKMLNLYYTESVAASGISLAAGDVVEGFIDYEIVSPLTNVAAIDIELAILTSAFALVLIKERGINNYAQNGDTMPVGRYTQRTPAGALRAGTPAETYPTMRIQLFDGSVTVGGVIKLHSMGFRKVA